MNCKELRAFTYYKQYNYSGFDTLELFYEDFIGIFKSYEDFYAYVFNVPKTFIEPNYILDNFYELYYTCGIDTFYDEELKCRTYGSFAVFKCR